MKKLFTVAIGAISAVCLLAGCTTGNNAASSAADDVKQAGEKIMNETQNAVDNVTDMGIAETGNMTQSDKKDNAGNKENVDNKDKVDKTQFIGEDKAKSIALEKAGLSADGVTFDKVELDRDDGVWQYEVEFRKDRTEYDADIKADDGSVLSWDVDNDD